MLDRLVNFEGRADRSEFWSIHIPTLALQLAALVFFGVRWFAAAHEGALDMAQLNLSGFAEVYSKHRAEILPIIFFPMLLQAAVAIRRMNDRGRPTWWVAFLVGPTIALLLLGQPNHQLVNPSLLSATALVLLVWYFVELGALPGTLGSAARANRSNGWVDTLVTHVGRITGVDNAATSAEKENLHAGAEAAIDRAVAERRTADRRGGERRVGMPDTRELKVERRVGDRRRAGERRSGDVSQGFGRRG